jgi:hypothetical protein
MPRIQQLGHYCIVILNCIFNAMCDKETTSAVPLVFRSGSLGSVTFQLNQASQCHRCLRVD